MARHYQLDLGRFVHRPGIGSQQHRQCQRWKGFGGIQSSTVSFKNVLTHFCNNFSFLVSMYHQRLLLFDRCCLGPATRIDRVNEIVFPLHLRGIGVTYTTLNIPEILCFLIGLFLIKCRNFCSFVFFRFNIISDLIAIFVLPFVFLILKSGNQCYAAITRIND